MFYNGIVTISQYGSTLNYFNVFLQYLTSIDQFFFGVDIFFKQMRRRFQWKTRRQNLNSHKVLQYEYILYKIKVCNVKNPIFIISNVYFGKLNNTLIEIIHSTRKKNQKGSKIQ